MSITKEYCAHLSVPSKITTRLHIPESQVFFGDGSINTFQSRVHDQHVSSEFEESTHYINNTQFNVSIMTRAGFCTVIVPSHGGDNSDTFIVRRMIRIRGDALKASKRYLGQLERTDERELATIREKLNEPILGYVKDVQILMDYTIPLKEIRSRKGTLYHYQTDIAISINPTGEMLPHPYSCRNEDIGPFGNEHYYKELPELNFKIRVVDHNRDAQPRYMRLGEKVYKLFPQTDAPARSMVIKANNKNITHVFGDYVEIIYSARNDPYDGTAQGVKKQRYSMDEARVQLGVFDTYEGALNPDTVAVERERELKAMTFAIEKLKLDNSSEKAQREVEALLHQKTVNELSHATEVLKAQIQLEAAQQKIIQGKLDNERAERLHQQEAMETLLKRQSFEHREYFDRKSIERKDYSDGLKLIPGVLIAIGTIVAAWFKVKKDLATA